jgi:hypothetical protein
VLFKFNFDIAIERTVELSCAHKGVKVAILARLHRLNKLSDSRLEANRLCFVALKLLQ